MLPPPDPRDLDRGERLRAPPVQPLLLPVAQRVRNFDEVCLPWTPEMVVREAARCLHCPDQPCVAACPLLTDVPLALWLTEHGDFDGAAEVFRRSNHFSEILARVCAQAHPCEKACPHGGDGGTPLAIGHIERFLADRHRKKVGWSPDRPSCTGYRVAVVGAGAAGLTVAELLAEKGHCVTLFDQWPAGGGRLRYGMPRFRLDHSRIRRRLHLLRSLGVEFVFDTRLGRDTRLRELFEKGFHAVFLGTGALATGPSAPPGVSLKGVHSSSSFLVRANVEQDLRPSEMEDPPEVGDSVVVLGGGEVVTDSCRTALRLGASQVTCMVPGPRMVEEGGSMDFELAREEGVDFLWNVAPLEILPNGSGGVGGVRCTRLLAQSRDGASGSRSDPPPRSEFEVKADTVVVATEAKPDLSLKTEVSGLEAGTGGYIGIDPSTCRTSREMVWAGGECVSGPTSLVAVVAQARRAAVDIHNKLTWCP